GERHLGGHAQRIDVDQDHEHERETELDAVTVLDAEAPRPQPMRPPEAHDQQETESERRIHEAFHARRLFGADAETDLVMTDGFGHARSREQRAAEYASGGAALECAFRTRKSRCSPPRRSVPTANPSFTQNWRSRCAACCRVKPI